MANLPLNELVVPGSQDVLELAPDLSAEVTALQGAVSTLNTDVSNIPNGTYPDLTAGSILTDKYDVDTTPYLYRAMPYISKRLEESIVGGSVVWNQLVNHGNFDNTNGWSRSNASAITFSVQNNVGKITIIDNTISTRPNITRNDCHPIVGHKYLLLGNIKITSSTLSDSSWYVLFGDSFNIKTVNANSWEELQGIVSPASTTRDYIQLYVDKTVSNFSNNDTIEYKNVQLIDLTAMFGSTIADYVYTLESGTAGAGVAWLKARGFFTKPYYDYDTGTLKSVNPTAHVTRGVNAWDEEWELGGYSVSSGAKTSASDQIRSKNKIRILPNTPYYFQFSSGTMNAVLFYDADETYLGSDAAIGISASGIKTTPSNAHYMTFQMSPAYGTTYKNDICINISDPTINGKYFPYEEHTYQLGDVTLRGIPKLVNNELVYDGDIYKYDGAVTRNYLTVTYDGSEDWYSVGAGFDANTNRALKSGVIPSQTGYSWDLIGSYVISTGQASSAPPLWQANFNTSGALIIGIPSSITTVAEWKAYLAEHPLTLIYKSTPTTETTTPFEQYQVCETGGTEEYTTTNDVPVGHDTKYFTDVIGNIENIPAPPTANGTYTLQVTVSASGTTYAWV